MRSWHLAVTRYVFAVLKLARPCYIVQMEKGIETRGKILSAAMHMVRGNGFDSLTIGETAKQVGMSKSGVFAHFESRDELIDQCH